MQWILVLLLAAFPTPVPVSGYSGDVMEPFLSRDGAVLFFNHRNDPAPETELHWARRVGDRFEYQGRLTGANSSVLDAVPSMDRSGRFYFITTRSYFENLSSVYRGMFDGTGVREVAPVAGLAAPAPGLLVLDAEVSADGEWLLFAEGRFSGPPVPDTSDIFVARRRGEGFERMASPLLARVNTAALEYAPALSSDGLALCFTRVVERRPQLYLCRRAALDQPFGEPVRLEAGEFVEAGTFTPDGRALLYHRLEGGRFRLYRLRIGP